MAGRKYGDEFLHVVRCGVDHDIQIIDRTYVPAAVRRDRRPSYDQECNAFGVEPLHELRIPAVGDDFRQ
ncbi:hypothetical protein XI03_07760 [Bradyrhizobium sp. CCBAU 65884]|nr:hypothetical protein [Bradyrhizobium sp. CCBAU 65884]